MLVRPLRTIASQALLSSFCCWSIKGVKSEEVVMFLLKVL